MQLEVSVLRTKRQRLGTRPLGEEESPREGLDRLIAWALTRNVPIESDLSWSPSDDGITARCPLPEGIEVHPDDGIIVVNERSHYEASVEVPSGDLDPAAVARALEQWANDAAFAVTGPFEVHVHRQAQAGYRLSLPVRRKPRRHHIDV